MNPKEARIVIIGGGISGASIAYHLAEAGCTDVTLIEKGYLASGATGRCGAGVRQQWGTRLNCQMAKESVAFFERAEEILGYDGDVEFKQAGYLIVGTNEEEDARFAENVALQQALDIPAEHLTPKQAKRLIPHLNTEGVTSATFCPTDGHLNPFLMTDAFYHAASERGVRFKTYTKVTDVRVKDGRVAGVETTAGDYPADVIINAAGGHAQLVGQMAGVEIPVQSQNREILVTEPIEKIQDPMVISFSRNIYCQQTPHGSFVMGRGDNRPSGYTTESSWQFLEAMAQTAVTLLPPLKDLRVVRQWGGLYNLSPDRQPIIGGTEVEGFYIACGYSGHGFMLAPVTGRLMKEIVLGEKPSLPLEELSLERFDGEDTEAYEQSVV